VYSFLDTNAFCFVLNCASLEEEEILWEFILFKCLIVDDVAEKEIKNNVREFVPHVHQ